MFDRATIRLGIGPHSSYYSFSISGSVRQIKLAARQLLGARNSYGGR